MKHMVHHDAKCPHYLHEDAQVIYCDGVQEDSVIHLAFANRTDAYNFKREFCRKNYEECPIYKMLEEIWKTGV